MPDNASEGMMETFASALVPAADACWAHARATVVGLPDTARRFDVDRCADKASLHTWLAWQEEPGCRTGLAVSRNLLRADTVATAALIGWIERWLSASSASR
jgi:uncharacterized protein DUF3226